MQVALTVRVGVFGVTSRDWRRVWDGGLGILPLPLSDVGIEVGFLVIPELVICAIVVAGGVQATDGFRSTQGGTGRTSI